MFLPDFQRTRAICERDLSTLGGNDLDVENSLRERQKTEGGDLHKQAIDQGDGHIIGYHQDGHG